MKLGLRDRIGKLSYRARFVLGVIGAILTPVIIVGLATLAAVKFTALPGDVAFRVFDTDVTKAEVAKQTGVLGILYGIAPSTDPALQDEIRRNTAQTVALDRVLDRAAVENGLAADDASAANAINQLLTQGGPAGQQQLESALAAIGATHQDLFEELKRQQLSQKLFEKVTREAGARQPVGDPEAQAYFDAHKTEFYKPESRHLRNIVVADKAHADAVETQLRGGADFATVAKASSLDPTTKDSGGDLGFLSSDQLEDAYAKEAFAAAPGTVLDPVQGGRGWNVGQVLEVRPGVQLTYPDVAGNLRLLIRQQKLAVAWQKWVGDQLERANVQYADDYRPVNPTDITPGAGLDRTPGEAATAAATGPQAPGAAPVPGAVAPAPAAPAPPAPAAPAPAPAPGG